MASRRWWPGLLVLLIICVSAWCDLALLTRRPIAVGFDGYYYVVQVEELRRSGGLYYPNHYPLVLYMLAGLSYAAGDVVLSVKLGGVLLHAALSLGIFATITSVTGSRWHGALGALMASLFVLRFYLISEFVSNLGGITLLVWGAWFLVKAATARRWVWVAPAALCLVAAVLSHRSIGAVTCLLALGLGLLYLLHRQGRAEDLRYGILIIVLASFLVPFLVMAQPYVRTAAWTAGEMLKTPRLPLTYGARVGNTEKLILLMLAPAMLCLLPLVRRRAPSKAAFYVLGLTALWSTSITLNPYLDHSVGVLNVVGRIDSLAYLQVAVLAAGVVWLAPRGRLKFIAAAALVTASLFARTADPLPKGLDENYLSFRAELLQTLPEHRRRLGDSPLIIAAHGNQFVATYALDAPAQQTFSEGVRGRSVYWLLQHADGGPAPTPGFTLFREEGSPAALLVGHQDLKRWLVSSSPAEKRRLLDDNPHLYQYTQGAK